MTSQYILECRQETAYASSQNGSWSNNLSKTVILEKGDQLQLKNVFIDTVKTNQSKVNFDEDTELRLSTCAYMINNFIINKTFYDGVDAGSPRPLPTKPDGLIYFTARSTPTGTPNLRRIQSIDFSEVKASRATFGGFAVALEWSLSGVKNYKVINIPAQNRIGKRRYTADVDFITDDMDSITFSPDDLKELDDNNVRFNKPATPPLFTELFWTPYVLTTSITIPKGSYEPNVFCQMINDEMTKPTKIDQNDAIVQNDILYTTKDKQSTTNFGMIAEDADTRLDSRNGGYIWTDGHGGYWLGSSQFDLAFDDVSSTFYFKFLHMPNYDVNGNIVANSVDGERYDPVNMDIDPVNYLTGSNSGILFTALQPPSFWSNTLGFNLNELIVDIRGNTKEVYVGNDLGLVPTFATRPIIGKSITSGFTGIDLGIKKTTDFQAVPAISASSTIINDQTDVIRGTPVFQNQTTEEPYFLISIKSNFSSTVIGDVRYDKTIQGIVSKYYSIDSFTTGDVSNAIVYEHLSDTPQLLRDFQIQIQDPDGTVANNIGPKNTVFLQLIKANPQSE